MPIMHYFKAKRRRGQRGGAQMAEFAATIPLIFIFVFGLIDLTTYMAAFATAGLVANVTARAAAPSISLTAAKSNADKAANCVLNGSDCPGGTTSMRFADFCNLTPKNSSALKLVVYQVAVQGGTKSAFSGTVDTSKFFYEYESECTFQIAPWIPFTALGPIPIIGVSSPMTFKSTSYVEHPEGLTN